MQVCVCARMHMYGNTYADCYKGEKLEIIKSFTPLQWRQLGFLMDLDDEGRTVDLVEAGHLMKGQTVCCQEVFKLWLKGPDATWGNLIELLIDCELPLLNRLKMH